MCVSISVLRLLVIVDTLFPRPSVLRHNRREPLLCRGASDEAKVASGRVHHGARSSECLASLSGEPLPCRGASGKRSSNGLKSTCSSQSESLCIVAGQAITNCNVDLELIFWTWLAFFCAYCCYRRIVHKGLSEMLDLPASDEGAFLQRGLAWQNIDSFARNTIDTESPFIASLGTQERSGNITKCRRPMNTLMWIHS